MVTTQELREVLQTSAEWLLIHSNGRSSAVLASEIDLADENGKSQFGILDESGFRNWRLRSAAVNEGEISLDLSGQFGRDSETVRLVKRTPAAELAAELIRARLEKANEIADLIKASQSNVKLGRVALNVDNNGRLAQIEFETADKKPTAAIADITGTLTPEIVLAGAIAWLDKLGERKKRPIRDLWLISEKRAAKGAQKLHALLTEFWHCRISVFEIDRRQDPVKLDALPRRKIRELWREKAPKLVIPANIEPSSTAAKIIDLAPDEIDLVFSQQGETLRFNGLPFARVRTMMGVEKAWFGMRRDRRALLRVNWNDLVRLVDELGENRSAAAPNRRHEYYRAAPEAWLESTLRRNIALLDANLLLSPLYNQFRSAKDKIDLLALRRDGRLVIIELKTQPDRAGIFQAADYWRKIELQRRRGILAAADLFDGREIADKPALVYLVAPAWSFHRDFEFFARALSHEIELWRFELHEEWRERVRVVSRVEYR